MSDIKEDIKQRAERARKFFFDKSEELIFPKSPLRDAALHYPRGGGKGFRPAMVMLSCGAVGGNEDDAIPVAAAVEALHVSSLLHDDWMDNDETRRGQVAAWKQWDPTTAILAGDVLLGFSFKILDHLMNTSLEVKFEVANQLALKYVELCHGQALDIGFTTKDPLSITNEEVTRMQYLKTGVLFEFCCVAGSMIGLNTTRHEYIDTLREYARLSGTAFQIQDDILGLVGDQEKLGKPVGSDIREGKRTTIAIKAINSANEEQKQEIMKGFGNPNASEEDYRRTLEIFEELGAIEEARNSAMNMANEALQLLDKLPDTPQKKVLVNFARYMIDREM